MGALIAQTNTCGTSASSTYRVSVFWKRRAFVMPTSSAKPLVAEERRVRILNKTLKDVSVQDDFIVLAQFVDLALLAFPPFL